MYFSISPFLSRELSYSVCARARARARASGSAMTMRALTALPSYQGKGRELAVKGEPSRGFHPVQHLQGDSDAFVLILRLNTIREKCLLMCYMFMRINCNTWRVSALSFLYMILFTHYTFVLYFSPS